MIVVPDSNIFISQVIPLAYSEVATTKLHEWAGDIFELVVPTLWSYEVVSTLRKAMTTGLLTQEQAEQGIDELLSFAIEEVHPTPALRKRTLDWAIALRQTVAYDAAFLALAESVSAAFWTAERRLHNTCKQLKLYWVNGLTG
ncbi:MAG: type II toxin-antitoxin system VapC family toxin [Cyanobacteria bacterium J06559_3]